MKQLRFELAEIGTTIEVERWGLGLRCIVHSAHYSGYQDAHIPVPLSHLPESFYSGIPKPLTYRAQRYGELALRLLCLARLSTSCRELLLQRPTLLAMACMYWPHHNLPILIYAKKGQRALLQGMKLPGKRSLLRFIDKLDLELDVDWQREYLWRLLRQSPVAYQALRHERGVTPVMLFFYFHAPELIASRLLRAPYISYAYIDKPWLWGCLDILNEGLNLARAGRFPGGWIRFRHLQRLEEIKSSVLQVEYADDCLRQFQHLMTSLGQQDPEHLQLPAQCVSYLATPWLQMVDSWHWLEQACAALDPRHCEVWSPTMLNEVMRGRQALFRICSPRRQRLVGWVLLAINSKGMAYEWDVSLLRVANAKGGFLGRYWHQKIWRHLSQQRAVMLSLLGNISETWDESDDEPLSAS